MKAVRFTETVEHRFVHDEAEAILPLNDIGALAREVGRCPIAETTLVGAVWKVHEGAEMSVPDKCADKLIGLGYAEPLPVADPVS
jgi:hypothetical protein